MTMVGVQQGEHSFRVVSAILAAPLHIHTLDWARARILSSMVPWFYLHGRRSCNTSTKRQTARSTAVKRSGYF